jgi:hypothetical protein
MSTTGRKFVVGLLALAALVGVYLLYLRTNRMPPIIVEIGQSTAGPLVDVNADASDAVGTVLDVGVGHVEQTRFRHRNERNEVDRDFGFVQLLHQQGNQWEITQPYLTLFFPAFRCEVTANRGKVQVDTVYSQPVVGDAEFSGNVVLHIIPAEPNDARECFIHLDDVGFLAAKSLFSSAGAVRFLSRRAQLTGTGLELIYDEARSRLELFRIFDLHSLRLRSRALGSVADLTPRRAAVAAPSPGSPAGPTPAPDAAEMPPGDRYQCVLARNVAIEMPDRTIRARDGLVIDNLLWSGGRGPGARPKPARDPNDSKALAPGGPDALDTTVSSYAAINAIPPESFDTVVTCAGGLEVTPMDTRLKVVDGRQTTEDSGHRAEDGEEKTEVAERDSEDKTPASVVRPSSSEALGRQRATARRIHFNVFTTDTRLEGPVEMAFLLDPNGLGAAQAATTATPMTITAQQGVRFVAAANQVLFEGGCEVTLSRSEPNRTQEYLLTAPRLVLDLVADPNRHSGYAVTARRLVTDGGPAALQILRRGSDQLLGWTRLNAAQLQYEIAPAGPGPEGAGQAHGAEFRALGPGEIWIRNDEPADSQADPNQFGLGQPCIARLTNFDTLTYSTATNRIVAADDAGQLVLDYFPLTEGKYDRHTRTVAGRVEVTLQETPQGRLELATLTATDGIVYEDESSHLSFAGSSLNYDFAQALVAVRGDERQGCYLNGALVDQIDLNLKTGRIQAEVPGPSTFQVR